MPAPRLLLLTLPLLLLSRAIAVQDSKPTSTATGTPIPTAGQETLAGVTQRIEAFTDREPSHVKVAWIQELSRFAEPGAANTLLRALSREKAPAVRAAIVRTLGTQTGPDVLRALIVELDASSDPARRETAALALSRQGEPGAGELIKRWRDARNTRDKEMLLRALGASGTSTGLPPVLEMLDHGTPLEKLSALESVRDIDGGEPLRRRRLACLADPFAGLKAEAILQLGTRGAPEGRAAAAAAVKSPERRMRAAATAVLGAAIAGPAELPAFAEAAAIEGGDLLPEAAAVFPRLRQSEPLWRWFLDKGMTHRDKLQQLLAVRVLATVPGEAVTKALCAAAAGDKVVATDALLLLAARPDPGCVPYLLDLFQKATAPDRRAAIVPAIHAHQPDDAVWLGALTGFVTSGPPEVRVAALEALAASRHRDALPVAHASLNQPSWMVRAAAIWFCRRVRDRASVPMLIARVDPEDGRLRQDAIDALESLTGLNFPTGKQWDAWWKEASGKFELIPDPETRALRGGATTTASWFDIPLTSRRVVFVIDVSASMNEPIGSGGVTRLTEARRELSEVIRRCDPAVYFNIVLFSTSVQPFQAGKLVPAGKTEKDAALKFVDVAQGLGGTDLFGALEVAFADPRVDTVYVLSDGLPSAGRIRNPDIIRDQVLRWCRARRVVVHAVSVGQESALLKGLATGSGGIHVVRS